MSKRVIALHASCQRRNTYNLLCQVRDLLAAEDIEVEIVELHSLDIHDCRGCLHCLEKGGCVWNDDFGPLWERVAGADGLILSSPVYVANYGALLKRWIDRAFVYVHRPVLAGMPVLAVTTAGGAYTGKVNRLMLSAGAMFGMRKAGAIARVSQTMGKPVTAREVRQFVSRVRRGRPARPTLGMLVMFQGARFAASFAPMDLAFWHASGWDRRLYVHEEALGWMRPIAWLLDRAMTPMMRRFVPHEAEAPAGE